MEVAYSRYTDSEWEPTGEFRRPRPGDYWIANGAGPGQGNRIYYSDGEVRKVIGCRHIVRSRVSSPLRDALLGDLEVMSETPVPTRPPAPTSDARWNGVAWYRT